MKKYRTITQEFFTILATEMLVQVDSEIQRRFQLTMIKKENRFIVDNVINLTLDEIYEKV